MKYSAHYDRLIARARGRVLTGYRERHHVLPRCMGGTDALDNLVDLTAEEHYLAHQLLVKIYPDVRGLATAAVRMSKQCTGNKAYGWLRRRHAAHASELHRGNKHCLGKKNNLGKRRSAESISLMSEKAKIRGFAPYMQSNLEKARLINIGNKYNLGKKQSPETIEKRRASRAGYRHSQETIKKISVSNTGRKPPTCRPVIHTGYGIFFDSAYEAASVLGISPGFLYNMLTGRRKNKTFLRFA